MILSNESSVVGKPNLFDLRDIIATVLDITLTAWKSVQVNGVVSRQDSEPAIAGRLGSAMLVEKNHRKPLQHQIRIEEEVGTRSTLHSAKPEGRIDIKIIYSFDESEYFGMECKRVGATRKDLAEKYIVDGIMRFVTGKYSPGHQWAAMLGFVIEGNSADCVTLLRNHVQKSRKITRMMNAWIADSTYGSYEHLYRTQHRQLGRKSKIAILHLFLKVD